MKQQHPPPPPSRPPPIRLQAMIINQGTITDHPLLSQCQVSTSSSTQSCQTASSCTASHNQRNGEFYQHEIRTLSVPKTHMPITWNASPLMTHNISHDSSVSQNNTLMYMKWMKLCFLHTTYLGIREVFMEKRW